MELKEEIKNMNKRIKRIIATVTVLMLGAFTLGYLHAEEVKVNESKLTNLSYVKKTYKTKCKYVREDGFYYYSSDGKAAFFKMKVPDPKAPDSADAVIKLGFVNVDDEVYGRVVCRMPGPGLTIACSLHDTEYSVKGKSAAYVSKEEAEDLVKQMKDLIIELALKLKEKTN